MIAHARRAVPWALVGVTAGLVIIMMTVVAHWTWTAWPLQGISVGLLAATAAHCLDEPTPELTDTAPRPLRWRAGAQGLGVAVLAGVWTVAVLALGGDLFGHRADVLGQGYAAMTAAVGAAALLRSRGVPAPGLGIAAWIIPAAMLLALGRPLPRELPVFPYTAEGPWQDSQILWSAAAILGLLALVAGLGDLVWHRPGSAAAAAPAGPIRTAR